MRARAVLILVCLSACGGGGGGGGGGTPQALSVVQTLPPDGSDTFATGTGISVTFSQSLDFATLSTSTLVLSRSDGSFVPSTIVTVPANPKNVWVEPSPDLLPDAIYRLVIKGTIRSRDGVPLGADDEICFATAGPVPAVREDQILDLGDRLNIPRYLAQTVRIGNRVFVIGGFRSATEATDRVEEWNPVTKSFTLLTAKLLGPRAEFTATLMTDGRILVAGGVSAPGGAPLATTEYLDVATGSSPGPPLLQARRWHAASRFRTSGVLVSGGFGGADTADPLDTLEYLESGSWHAHPGTLERPVAQHIQYVNGFDDVWVTGGNVDQFAARVNSVTVVPFVEPDARFRAQGVVLSDGRVMVVAGDTRSVVIHDFGVPATYIANDLLFDRRGAYSLTAWGSSGRVYLAAGGFQISAGGRVITSLELVEYDQNPGGAPDAIVYTVTASELPVGMAGHVGFNDPSGASVLAGGIGDGVGDHLRRVVMILDDRTTPPVSCD